MDKVYVYASYNRDEVTISVPGETEDLTPQEARELAADLLAKANYAEGVSSTDPAVQYDSKEVIPS